MVKDMKNEVVLSGRVLEDAEVSRKGRGWLARFTLALTRWVDGHREPLTAYQHFHMWRRNGAQGDFALLRKGRLVTVEGIFVPVRFVAKDGTPTERVQIEATLVRPMASVTA